MSRTNKNLEKLSAIYPTRNPVRWKMENGKVVITYKKDFRSFEKFLYRKFGGVSHIRRPLDELGTRIWLLCDGRKSFADICIVMDEEFKEKIEPVSKRVWTFIEILIRVGLMRLESAPRGNIPLRVCKKPLFSDDTVKRVSPAPSESPRIPAGKRGHP